MTADGVLLRPEVVQRLSRAGSVFAEDEAEILISEAQGPAHLGDMLARRVEGVPLEHVVGWAGFCGMRVEVGEGVFVPRRRTEFLVEVALEQAGVGATVLDLCCGSGAIGAALARAASSAHIHAVDIDPRAVSCAAANLSGLGAHVYAGDLFDPLPASLLGTVDLLVASPPYVPTDSLALMPAEARLYEPHVALDGGEHGLSTLSRIVEAAPRWLAPDGRMLLETSTEQAPHVAERCSARGLTAVVRSSEDRGSTVVVSTFG
jgi:release factor glutamine methyltransferase